MPKRQKLGGGRSYGTRGGGSRFASRKARRPFRAPRKFRRKEAHETGYKDLAYATYALDTTGSITLLNTVAQGASVNERVGKKYMIKSVQFRGQALSNATTTTTEGAALLVYDKRPTGSLPAITDILDTATSKSFPKDDNTDRFLTLRRWDWSLCGNTATAGQQTSASSIQFEEYVKVGKKCVCKAAGTGAIGDIAEGALYLVTVGAAAAGTTAGALGCGVRVRFVDY